jgi:hypothetical protein
MNCWVLPPESETSAGVIVTLIGGVRATVAVADFVPSVTLVAVTVTIWAEPIMAGAV